MQREDVDGYKLRYSDTACDVYTVATSELGVSVAMQKEKVVPALPATIKQNSDVMSISESNNTVCIHEDREESATMDADMQHINIVTGLL